MFLELVLQAELHNSGRSGAEDPAYVGVAGGGVRKSEIHAVEKVEELRTELHPMAFRKAEIPE
jgi:hypothetical protein